MRLCSYIAPFHLLFLWYYCLHIMSIYVIIETWEQIIIITLYYLIFLMKMREVEQAYIYRHFNINFLYSFCLSFLSVNSCHHLMNISLFYTCSYPQFCAFIVKDITYLNVIGLSNVIIYIPFYRWNAFFQSVLALVSWKLAGVSQAVLQSCLHNCCSFYILLSSPWKKLPW